MRFSISQVSSKDIIFYIYLCIYAWYLHDSTSGDTSELYSEKCAWNGGHLELFFTCTLSWMEPMTFTYKNSAAVKV